MTAPSPRVRLAIAALLFSTGGAAIKYATFTSWQVASLRSGVAAVAVALMLPEARRGWTARTALVGVGYAVTLVLFVLANKLTTSASTIFLQSTAPLYILLLAPWLLREPVRRADLPFMAALALGLVLFFVGADAPVATAPDPVRGNLLAAASGVGWAVTMMGLRWMGTRGGESPAAAVVLGNLFAFLGCLPFALPLGHHGVADWATIGYLGVFQIAVAYVCVTTAIGHVPALEASLLLLLEPAFNPLWAWLVHGERPGPWAVAGGTLILGAMLARARRQARLAGAARPAG